MRKYSLLVVVNLAYLVHCFGYTEYEEKDPRHWYAKAHEELRERIDIYKPIHRRARNVILFLGDGMGISTITASRILKGQRAGQPGEEGYLEFDRFPHSALIKTYNIDRQVPDSAGTATAYLCGVKANYATLGVSARVNQTELDCDYMKKHSVDSIMKWAVDAGKATGIVTTTRITHATPAAAYAHIATRKWESEIQNETKGTCKDIAKQLIEDSPGSELNVILGGGRGHFLPTTQFDPKGIRSNGELKAMKGNRKDGRNLVRDWLTIRRKSGLSANQYAFVNSTRTLRSVNYDKLDYLFGLFNYSHMEYEQLRDRSDDGEPSLTEMTEAAIRVLSRKPKGFVLLVEGGRIDHAHHNGFANMALHETIEFNRAIRRAREMVTMEDTLILVTADHSHTLTINGYPVRGNPIQGIGGIDNHDEPYTTLMYGNGPGHRDLPLNANDLYDLKHQATAAVELAQANHGGEDVGPMAHLFGGTHEQSYIAHVMAYAACIGYHKAKPHCYDDRLKYSFDSSHFLSYHSRLFNSGPQLGAAAFTLFVSIIVSIAFKL